MQKKHLIWNGLVSLASLGFVVTMIGCGPKKPETYPVEGVVTLNGEPVEVVLEFYSPTGTQPAFARSDQTGEFSVSTFGKGDGAMPGEYQVVVTTSTDAGAGKGPDTTALPDEDPAESSPEDLEVSSADIPKIYTQRSTAPITVNITPEGDNNLQIELESQ